MHGGGYQWDCSRLSGLKNSRLFMTGGTGFFGKWLLRFFVETVNELHVDVTVLSRDPERFRRENPELGNAPNVAFVRGDVRTFDFPEGLFDYVLHAAAPVGSGHVPYDSSEMYSIVVEGTQRVLDFAEQAQVRRMLYVSSGAVYGAQPAGLEQFPETSPCHPENAYGKGKLECERLCLEREFDVVITRCFAFVGEYLQLDNRFAIGNFILDCMENRPIRIKGDGTPLRSYMHGFDLVQWLLISMLCGSVGEIYNVGSDQAVSIAQTAELVRDVIGVDNQIIIEQEADPTRLPPRYIPSILKAERELGLTLSVNLRAAIEATVQYWKEGRHGS